VKTPACWQPDNAVVIGAGSGIGHAVALAFAARGLPVTALCRRPQSFDHGNYPGKIDVRGCDVTVPDELDRALAASVGRSVVVHTAASAHPIAPIWQCQGPAGREAVATMVTSAWQTASTALDLMNSAGAGLLLLASSGAAGKIAPARATYSMCKAAVDQLVRVVGAELELAGDDVGIAAFYPGMVDTPMQADARAAARRLAGTTFAGELDVFGATAASGSLLLPDEVAQDLLSLAGRAPREVNGRIWRLRRREWTSL
jgi:NAD(P)-dependent dehydrogenase (short-subunit alcohol dehydrogenase family)